MMRKLEDVGCSKQVVGLVVPTGYSFNLDGTSIYLSMAALFIAQAYGVACVVVSKSEKEFEATEAGEGIAIHK